MEKFIVNIKGDLIYYTVRAFDKYGIHNMYTTKAGGVSKNQYSSLNFSLGDDEKEKNVIKNYEIALSAIDCDINSLVCTKQVHGNNVITVTKADCGRGVLRPHDWEADGLITNEKGVTLAAYYADCAALAFFDTKEKVIGVAHAGWRGAVGHIASKTVKTMSEQFGCNPNNILVSVGPCICKSCFQVGDEVCTQVLQSYGNSAETLITKTQSGNYLDLAGLNQSDLIQCGVPNENISMSNLCTCCNSHRFWSHRKTNGIRGKHAVFIGM